MMSFISTAIGFLGVLLLCMGIIGGLCPKLLKDSKTGQIPKRGDMLFGLVIGFLLLLLAAYLSPSETIEIFMLVAVPIGIVCSLIYGGIHAVREKNKPTQQTGSTPITPARKEVLPTVVPESTTKEDASINTKTLLVNPSNTRTAQRGSSRPQTVNHSHPLGRAIAPMLKSGDWDTARRYLQKIAYGMPNATKKEKDEFTQFMAGFASQDPLYQNSLINIQHALKDHPDGVRQTALYPHITAALDVEEARYVLYYADVLGDIVRIKKGNSYMVFPKGTIPSLAPLKKTIARKRSPAR